MFLKIKLLYYLTPIALPVDGKLTLGLTSGKGWRVATLMQRIMFQYKYVQIILLGKIEFSVLFCDKINSLKF